MASSSRVIFWQENKIMDLGMISREACDGEEVYNLDEHVEIED